MSRRVVGPVAVIPDSEGRLRYFYRGSYLPDGLDGDAVQRCIDRDLVAEIEDQAPAEADDDESDDEGSEDDGSDDELDDDEADDGEPAPERPKLTASTEAWQAFRRPTHGDAVDGMSRQQLIDLG